MIDTDLGDRSSQREGARPPAVSFDLGGFLAVSMFSDC